MEQRRQLAPQAVPQPRAKPVQHQLRLRARSPPVPLQGFRAGGRSGAKPGNNRAKCVESRSVRVRAAAQHLRPMVSLRRKGTTYARIACAACKPSCRSRKSACGPNRKAWGCARALVALGSCAWSGLACEIKRGSWPQGYGAPRLDVLGQHQAGQLEVRGGAGRQVHEQETVDGLAVLVEDCQVRKAARGRVLDDLLQRQALQGRVQMQDAGQTAVSRALLHIAAQERLSQDNQKMRGSGGILCMADEAEAFDVPHTGVLTSSREMH